MRRPLSVLSAVAAAALLGACSAVGVRSGTEEPRYEVVDRLSDEVEVRRYETRLAAEVEVPGGNGSEPSNAAFRILAGYIFGANQAQQEIAMTAPVAVDRATTAKAEKIAMTAPVETVAAADGGQRMRFFLPAGYSLETAPVPTDPRVRLVPVPAEEVAVLQFSGRWQADSITPKAAVLLAALEQSSWQPAGAPGAWFYDPPWTLAFLRRNEVAVTVSRR